MPTTIRTIIALAAALAATTTATAQITPGEAFTLERDAQYHASFGDQFYGAVCAGPGEYFSVWVDLRIGGLAAAGYDLYAQRTRPDGTTPTPGSIELLRDLDRLTSGIPGVAFNGSMYLVAWNEGSRLYAMRVDTDGNPLDPGGFVVGTRSSLQWPSVASDGQDFLIVQGGRDGNAYATRVAADGTVLDPAGIILDSGATSMGYPKAIHADGSYMVVWSRLPSGHVRGMRITSAGAMLDPIGGFTISDGTFDVDPHVDFDGQDFFVVWQRRNVDEAFDLYGAHVTTEGAPSATPANLLLDAASFGSISSGQVAWNGSHHLVTITTNEPLFSNTDLYALRVDADGFPAGAPFPVSTLEGQSQVAMGVASVDDQWFIVWEGNYVLGVSYVYNTEGARIDASGNVLDRPRQLSVSNSAAWQVASATAFDGQNFFTVFEDWREGPKIYSSDLYAVRTTPDGTPLDDAAIRVAAIPGTDQQQPDAILGPDHLAVVFESNAAATNQIRFTRVSLDGQPLDPPSGHLIFANEPTGEAFQPAIAWNGDHYAVAWYDNLLFAGQQPIQFALVNPDGSVAVGPVHVPGTNWAGQDTFDITPGPDGDFLLTWAALDPGGVRATRIGPDGRVLQTRLIESTGSWITNHTHPAWNGERYIVAWTRWGDGGVRVYARPLAADLTPLAPTSVVTGPHQRVYSGDAFPTPGGFMVAGGRTIGQQIETYLTPIDTNGQPTGPDVILQGAHRDETYSGASFAAGAGKVMASQSLWASNPYNAPRLHGQMIDLGATCPPDLDGDGELTIFDFLTFQNLFQDADPRADLDGDGEFTIFDFLAYQNAFDAGCG